MVHSDAVSLRSVPCCQAFSKHSFGAGRRPELDCTFASMRRGRNYIITRLSKVADLGALSTVFGRYLVFGYVSLGPVNLRLIPCTSSSQVSSGARA